VLVAAIDRNRIEPPYLQLAMILEDQIRSGALAPGARVPSISTLMGEYDVGKNTAIRAIAELRVKELVQVVPGWGTFVATSFSPEP
jgi:GntR family transcriptional regulator